MVADIGFRTYCAQELKSGNYKLEKMCIEPTSFTVKEESSFKGGESEFVRTKLMTRLTYTLDAVSNPTRQSHAAAAAARDSHERIWAAGARD